MMQAAVFEERAVVTENRPRRVVQMQGGRDGARGSGLPAR